MTRAKPKPFVALVAKSLESGLPFDASLRVGIKAVLASPKFLLLREPVGTLDDYALASRLSYFLWSTMPDETLLATAAKNELHKPEVLARNRNGCSHTPRLGPLPRTSLDSG